jgi:hypothetical protein
VPTRLNLMGYNDSIHLAKFQWDIIHNNSGEVEFDSTGQAAIAKSTNYYITIDGIKAFKFDIKIFKEEFNKTKLMEDNERHDYLKTIQLYVISSDKSDYTISTQYVNNGTDKGNASELFFDNQRILKTQNVSFASESHRKSEEIDLFYSDGTVTSPIYRIELLRVIPNIAYKQDDKIDYIIREEKSSDRLINKIELSGNKVSLRPVFLTKNEQDLGEDITPLFERNQQCSRFVRSIQFDNKQYDLDSTLDWVEYSINAEGSTYEIVTESDTVKGIVKSVAVSPFVTVKRHNTNEDTGYYIEDYYSTNFVPQYPSLREDNNTMKTGGFDASGKPYKIPIVHYKNSCNVKLSLAEIPQNENSSPLRYKIGDKTIELGKEFTIQTPSHGTVLDIKDIDGNVKGEIEFRQITESLLTPTLNIVTLNTDNSGVDFSSTISYLNGIYNTMHVNWQQGEQIVLNVNKTNNELAQIYDNKIVMEDVLKKLKGHPDYKVTQYYMIIAPVLPVSGFAPSNLNDNWFFVRPDFDDVTPSHELGHCNGLDEFAVNIGHIPSSRRNESAGNYTQHNNTNIMGYGSPLKDFYSWQIPLIRENISIRINTK